MGRRIARLEKDSAIAVSVEKADAYLGKAETLPTTSLPVHGSTKHDGTVEASANKGVASGYCDLDASILVPLSRIPATLVGKDADTVDTYHASALEKIVNKGVANGYASLDLGGKVPSAQLPPDVVLSVFGRVGAVVALANDYTWGQINKTVSSLADITTKSHTVLSDIGTNTHAQIDTHLGASSGIHGVAGSVVGTSDVQTLLNKLLQSPKIKDVDTIPVADVLLKVMSGILQARNSADSAYAPLILSQLAVGTPTVGGLINAVGDTSVLGALVRIQDTKAVPSGQQVFSFTNNTSTLFTVDNLGDVEVRRWLQWGEYNTAKYGRLAVPASDGFLGILAQGTDVNIDIEMRPQGTGKLIIGGGGTSASGEGHITILPWNYNNIIQGNWVFSMDALQILNGYFYNSPAANLDQVDYKVYLAPGTYTFRLVYYKQSTNGIKDILIDGTSVGTIDGYSATTVTNAVSSIIGIVVTTGGLKTLSVKVNGKNASSSGYQVVFTSIGLWRTA